MIEKVTEKKRLLVVAGAGAAIDFGMPSVRCIGDILRSKAQEDFGLAERPAENLYGYICEEIARHWSVHTGAGPACRKPNFEDVLYVLSALAAAFPLGVLTPALGAFLLPPKLPDVLLFGKRRTVDTRVVQLLSRMLVDHLLSLFRDRCRPATPGPSDNLQLLHKFFVELQHFFDVAVVSTNYDDLICGTLPQLETGFSRSDKGRFDPGRVFHRTSWPCLLQLHGSVHFDMRTSGSHFDTICWEDNLDICHASSISFASRYSIEGNIYPASCIVAGYGKTFQILTEPFRTYYSELDRLIHESDAVLFLGCGFGDLHLNAGFHDYGLRRDRRIVVIDFASNETLTAGSGFNTDSLMTAQRAMQLFGIAPHQLSWLGKKMPNGLEPLRRARDFERSQDAGQRLSSWYNGMLEACRYPEKIVSELMGAGPSS